MFHVEHEHEAFDAIEGWLAIDLDSSQRDQFLRFERWLREEALHAGGIGPREGERLLDRHIVDSLTFQIGIPKNATAIVDIGGGVGLPSIPLAVARPDIAFTLVDRSQRRTELARRAARILGLENFATSTSDVLALDPIFDVALFRASLPIEAAADVLPLCVGPTGIGLFAVSRQHERPSVPKAPEGITFALSHEGDGILASPFWLLEMRRN